MFSEYADKYLKQGLSIFPAKPDKKPVIPAWAAFQTRLPSAEEIEAWSKDLGDMNIAIVCGRLSNLTVIDCDIPQAIQAVEKLLPEGMELPIVTTPRGGRHYYFRYCPKLHSRNGAGDGIDVKSEGGYVLAPPSKTENGVYTWNSEMNLDTIPERPPVPDALLALLKAGTTSPAIPSPDKPILTLGTRDQDLFHAALELLKDGRLRDEVERIIVNMGKICTPPFPEKEALAKVASAWKHQQQKTVTQEETFDISEFTDITMRPIRWLWYPIAPVGMVGTVLGEPGIGKTFLLADLVARISSGRPLPVYRKPTDQVVHGWVIYITSEGVPDQILKPRLYAAGADMANITLIKGIMTREGDYDLLDIRRHLVPLVARIKQDKRTCALVVIDPIASFVSSKTNLNDSAQTRHALDAVARFAENADVAVLVAIHPNKDETLKLMSRSSGSVQISAAVKTAWVVADPKEDDPQNMRYFAPYKIATVPFNKKETLPFFMESADFQHDGKTIEMANLRWSTEIIKCDVEHIISPRANETGVNQTSKACALLKDALKNGPRYSDELFAQAETMGVNRDPLYRAKAKLAIKASPEHFSGKWKWIPPDEWPEEGKNA